MDSGDWPSSILVQALEFFLSLERAILGEYCACCANPSVRARRAWNNLSSVAFYAFKFLISLSDINPRTQCSYIVYLITFSCVMDKRMAGIRFSVAVPVHRLAAAGRRRLSPSGQAGGKRDRDHRGVPEVGMVGMNMLLVGW